ncbi:uncharacterized protein LOC144931505 isoform X2 [Lampetra fluviatilis]
MAYVDCSHLKNARPPRPPPTSMASREGVRVPSPSRLGPVFVTTRPAVLKSASQLLLEQEQRRGAVASAAAAAAAAATATATKMRSKVQQLAEPSKALKSTAIQTSPWIKRQALTVPSRHGLKSTKVCSNSIQVAIVHHSAERQVGIEENVSVRTESDDFKPPGCQEPKQTSRRLNNLSEKTDISAGCGQADQNAVNSPRSKNKQASSAQNEKGTHGVGSGGTEEHIKPSKELHSESDKALSVDAENDKRQTTATELAVAVLEQITTLTSHMAPSQTRIARQPIEHPLILSEELLNFQKLSAEKLIIQHDFKVETPESLAIKGEANNLSSPNRVAFGTGNRSPCKNDCPPDLRKDHNLNELITIDSDEDPKHNPSRQARGSSQDQSSTAGGDDLTQQQQQSHQSAEERQGSNKDLQGSWEEVEELRKKLRTLEEVLRASQDTIKLLLSVIQELERVQAHKEGSYRSGQDMTNCDACRKSACIIYSVEHDFKQQEDKIHRQLKPKETPCPGTTPQEEVIDTQPPPSPEVKAPESPPSPVQQKALRPLGKREKKGCFWFL